MQLFFLFLPVIYMLVGLAVGKIGVDLKVFSSKLIMKVLIPLVLFYFMLTGKEQVLIVAGAMSVIFIIVYLIIIRFTKDPIKIIMFLIPNVGWTGLPVAGILFGNTGTIIFIGMFVTSSLIINGLGDILFTKRSGIEIFKSMLRVPSNLAFLLALFLLPFDIGYYLELYLSGVFKIIIIIITFFGMFLIGQWMAITKFTIQDLFKEIPLHIYKVSLFFILIVALHFVGVWLNIPIIKDNILVYILMCVLPATSGVISLETYYEGTGRSIVYVVCNTIVGLVTLIIFSMFVLQFN